MREEGRHQEAAGRADDRASEAERVAQEERERQAREKAAEDQL
jgi:hypothetical protein